ncbi:hypothetical protein MHYP_G00256850 [Metynnis hypsauchen]
MTDSVWRLEVWWTTEASPKRTFDVALETAVKYELSARGSEVESAVETRFWKSHYATAPQTSPRSRSVLLSSLSKEVQACLLKDPWFTSNPITSKHAIQQALIMKAYSEVEYLFFFTGASDLAPTVPGSPWTSGLHPALAPVRDEPYSA